MTIDFIPIEYYSLVFFHLMWLFVLGAVVLVSSAPPHLLRFDPKLQYFGYATLLLVTLYMGLRPISGHFVDMVTYAQIFERIAADPGSIPFTKDWIFSGLIKTSAQLIDAQTFFLVCAILYVVPFYFIAKKNFSAFWPIGLVAMISFYGFWSYGVNGIRQGLGSSWFLLAFCSPKLRYQILFCVLATGFHTALLLPSAALMAARFGPGPRVWLMFWILCIPLSWGMGSFWENFFANLGFEDERIAYLTTEGDERKFAVTGFRWDFLLFSAVPVAIGYYFVDILKYTDKVYSWLFSTYLITNAFWILVIRANFSNRFAQLSWSLMGFLVIYPLLRQRLLPNQEKYLGLGLVIFYGMTYFLHIVFKSLG